MSASIWEAGTVSLYRELMEKKRLAEEKFHETGCSRWEGEFLALAVVCALFRRRISEIEEVERFEDDNPADTWLISSTLGET